MIKLPKLLPKPTLPENLPENAQWLAGEGAGSWFTFDKSNNNNYNIIRYSPSGEFECNGIFCPDKEFDISAAFEITFPSYCSKVTVIQDGATITFLPKKLDS